MNYIDLNIFFNKLIRNKIIELTIKKVIYNNIEYLLVDAIHYHGNKNKDDYLIKSEQIFCIHNLNYITISPLIKLINLERLIITDIPILYELPSITDCINLKTLICHKNNLSKLPRKFPKSLMYVNCSNNKLSELPIIHEGLYIYCHYNNLYSLPLFPNKFIIYFDNNPVKNLYISNHSEHMKTTNRILYKLKYNYYFIKYSKKIFRYFLRKRMNRIKNELLIKSAIITMNPKRIERILNLYEICGYDFDDI
jgi:Leucine-rich repeat (LRR) protein